MYDLQVARPVVSYEPNNNSKFSSIHLNETVYTDPSGIGTNLSDEEALITRLLQRNSLKVRPTACFRCFGAVTVNITYNVIQILAFSQAEETFSISGWFTLSWQDYRLSWQPQRYGDLNQVFLPSKRLWLPDVGVMNGRNNKDFDFSAQSQSRMSVDSDGVVTWMHGVILDVTCPLDVSYFPFDSQTCYIILTPWQSHVRQILMVPVQHGSAVDNSYLPNSNISEWMIKHVIFKYKSYVSQVNITYQYITISIRVQRQPLYFIILVLVPFAMLSGLACLIFTLDDSGDRLSVALSLVLSMTMYVVIVSTNAPRSMRTLPVLCIYLLNQLGLLSISTVMAVFNQKLREKYLPLSWRESEMVSANQGLLFSRDNPIESPIAQLKNAWQKRSHIRYPHGEYFQENYQLFNSNLQCSKFRDNCILNHNANKEEVRSPDAEVLSDSDWLARDLQPTLSSHPGLKVIGQGQTRTRRKRPKSAGTSRITEQEALKRRDHYRRLATKLDKLELMFYLVVSLVNAVICLIIMPRYYQPD